jgi:hypothetical protein
VNVKHDFPKYFTSGQHKSAFLSQNTVLRIEKCAQHKIFWATKINSFFCELVGNPPLSRDWGFLQASNKNVNHFKLQFFI